MQGFPYVCDAEVCVNKSTNDRLFRFGFGRGEVREAVENRAGCCKRFETKKHVLTIDRTRKALTFAEDVEIVVNRKNRYNKWLTIEPNYYIMCRLHVER